MKQEFYTQLSARLDTQLEEAIAAALSPMERLKTTVPLIRAALNELQDFAKTDNIFTPQEETYFFKVLKPGIYRQMIYEVHLYQMLINLPAGTKETLGYYYHEELGIIQRYFNSNAFAYQYYKLQISELDHLYFIRGAEVPEYIIPETPDTVPHFTTAMDYRFAKFMAYERLQAFIMEQLNEPDTTLKDPAPGLHWTGDTINLAELIYGLYLTGQLNHGNATATQITKWFEQKFNIRIGIIHRRFEEIERRKRLPITKFLDQMKDALLKKVEKTLE